jgi:ABC-type multidrug transport system ATPase subunit
MRRLIRELSAEGKTIFLTSHILEDLESLCTHLTVIKKGQIIVTGASQDIWSEHPAMMEVTSVNPQHELCRDDIEPESLPQTLQTMISEQRQILSIIPRRRSLEQWFE